ncbi:carbohydrate ABC transporter permease [Paenibacillus lautus]|uniref:carbohydrate ABC transporter permease n=1 Tax=Paenibacillus lautus TaxID=1401 RepID=UPI001C106998|nr:carbohydrate ABC transporter permease [Paenibacillus lautus]MBU5348312.1 carbohydrate ABC transporter permease [Paenibacillus lautus]
MYHKSKSYRLFYGFNLAFLIFISVLCILPLIHILAVSFSSASAAAANLVTLWPVDFTLKSYQETLSNGKFLDALFISVMRVVLVLSLGMIVTVLSAYPLSKFNLKGGKWLAWFFVITMLFQGGLIPSYVLILELGIMNTLWALILPSIVNVYNIILMLNFFRSIPREMEEAALIDGAGQLVTLFRVYLPISMPSIATIALFIAVQQWNSWFDGLIFLSDTSKWPLSTLLQNLLIAPDLTNSQIDTETLAQMSEKTIRASQIFIGALPILIVYPFLQRFFVKGIVLGAVKE